MMANRGRVVIDLSDDDSPEPETESHFPALRQSQQHVPESRFITPDDDSDEAPQVLWGTRQKRNDIAATNTLRSNPPPQRNGPLPNANWRMQKDGKNNAAARTPALPQPSRPSRPAAPIPSINTVPRPAQHFVPSQIPMTRPDDSKPVSILHPRTEQWFQAQRSRTATPSTSASRPQPHHPPVGRHNASATPLPASTTPQVLSRAPNSFESSHLQHPQRSQHSPVSRTAHGSFSSRQVLPDSSSLSAAVSSQDPRPSNGQTLNIVPSQKHQIPSISSQKPPTAASALFQKHPTVASHPSTSLHTTPRDWVQITGPRAPRSPFTMAPNPAATSSIRPTITGSSSSESSFVIAEDNSRSTSAHTYTPPKGKRKIEVIEIDDDDDDDNDEGPIKRTRRTNASTQSSSQELPSPGSSGEDALAVEILDAAANDDDEVDDQQSQFTFPSDLSKIPPFPNNYGKPFTPEEDALVIYLKEIKTLPWKDFEKFFPGRRWPSLQTRYSKVLSKRTRPSGARTAGQTNPWGRPAATAPPLIRQENTVARRETRATNAHANAVGPFIAYEEQPPDVFDDTMRRRRIARPLSYLVRHREMGATRGKEWPSKFQAGMKDLAYSTLGAETYMENASGDVSTVAWSPDGNFFAAGAVAVTDPQSAQYNKPRNLIIGSSTTRKVKELPHHRIKHQRKELFSTVQMVAFSPDSNRLYSVGIDQRLNAYKIDGSALETELVETSNHAASVDFLTVSNDGLVATGAAYSGPGAIRVLHHSEDSTLGSLYFSGTNATPQTRKRPSALKWGAAAHHKNFLLAGFSCEADVVYAEDDQRDRLGEVAMWDVTSQQRLKLPTPNVSVFDVCWNPNPSSASSIFAVASRTSEKVSYGMHSVVRLYSPTENDPGRARHLVELECPAYDINDVIYSPHDDHLVAVGSTEGKVYIWDIRFAKRTQLPLRTLEHGESLAVLPHEKKRWDADTGIRFLSWGSERDRLYTGSSDGVVSCWDPYRSDEDKHVRDVVKLNSAIMSGAFSPDFCSLLVGEDASRLNLLTIGNEGATFDRTIPKFHVTEAPLPEEPAPNSIDCESLLASGALEVRPAGTMPFRQVVQGPNYMGPYLDDQDAAKSHAEAHSFQDKAFRSRSRRNKLMRKWGYPATDECSLDCGHMPVQDHEENGRSDDRIPNQLWDFVPAGKAGFFSGRCNTCSRCGGAARLSKADRGSGDDVQVLCEKCGFGCFRCGRTATISPTCKAIECAFCGLAWSIGALGYDLIRDVEAMESRRKAVVSETQSVEDLGEGERDHFLCEALVGDLSEEDILGG